MSIVALSSPSSSPLLEPLPQCLSSVSELLHGKSWTSVRYPVNGLTCTHMATECPRKCRKGCFQQRNLPRRYVRANSGDDRAGGSDDGKGSSASTTVEQGKRILALQKDLLEQIAERKKLMTALKENLGTAKEQVKSLSSNHMRPADSMILEVPPEQDLMAERRPLPVDVTSSNPPGQVSQPPASYKAAITREEPETKPPTLVEVPTVKHMQDSSDSSSVTLPARKVSTPLEEKELLKVADKQKESVSSVPSSDEPAFASSSLKNMVEAPPLAGPNVMNVIVVAAECAPWSKTGGLGDVAGALPKALARRGHRVMVVAPRYKVYDESREIGLRKRYKVAGQDLEVGYFHAYIDGVDYVFADNSVFHGFANNIYGGNREDVLKRMVLLCKAAVEAPWYVPCGGVCYGDGNLVFIANDWHTALLPVYLQAYYRDNGMMGFARSILVIHNMSHQGRGPLSDFSLLDLPDHYIDKFRLYDPVGGEHMNVFMAGLITAHRIVAVSHGYAWECQTQLGGWGLDGVMREHNWKLRGVVNGIDDKEWSPELDSHLNSDGYTNYSLDTLHIGKAVCKAALQKELKLPVRSNVPLLGFIGRLDHQKGVDLIADAMPWMMEQDLQLVMLGTGRADLENMLRSFEGQYRDKVRAYVGFSVKTAHRITAGCDILLMPSRFEPCGLNQLYGMRYGTIPVVHAVGGLRDTVQPFDPYANSGTGWTFEKAEASGLVHALGNAMWTFRDFKESWRAIQIRGMSQDLSWDNAAKQYEEVMVAAKYQW